MRHGTSSTSLVRSTAALDNAYANAHWQWVTDLETNQLKNVQNGGLSIKASNAYSCCDVQS